jgi:pyruvate formate-lyase activating enzyme-like uncharacterized protein
MIRDRDGLSNEQIKALEEKGRIKCLKKRHIENYFLDSDILFKVAERLCLTTINPEITKVSVESKIKEIAAKTLNYNLLQNIKEYLGLNHGFEIPTIREVESKTLEAVGTEMLSEVQASLGQLSNALSETNLKQWIKTEEIRLKNCLETGEWKSQFHGKPIFSKLCSEVLKDDPLKIRQAYVDIALKENPQVFKDIIEILASF